YIDRILGDTDIVPHSRSIRISAASDDASQAAAANNNILNEQSLVIGGSSEQIVGLRFQDVPIPRNATITQARLVFVPAANHSDEVILKVLPEKSGDAPTYSATADGRLSNR